jgi:hypothetical protein
MSVKMDEKQEKQGPGQPTLFRDEYIEQAYKLTLLGATDKELANFFDVCEATITNWKQNLPEFLASIKSGKEKADANVAERLYQRAMGYEHPETKVFCQEGEIIEHEVIKHYPPEVAAIAFWLKNRQSKMWRDSHDFTSGGEKIVPQVVSFIDAMKQTECEKPQDSETQDNDTE